MCSYGLTLARYGQSPPRSRDPRTNPASDRLARHVFVGTHPGSVRTRSAAQLGSGGVGDGPACATCVFVGSPWRGTNTIGGARPRPRPPGPPGPAGGSVRASCVRNDPAWAGTNAPPLRRAGLPGWYPAQRLAGCVRTDPTWVGTDHIANREPSGGVGGPGTSPERPKPRLPSGATAVLVSHAGRVLVRTHPVSIRAQLTNEGSLDESRVGRHERRQTDRRS
jgi:hypothetical protein